MHFTELLIAAGLAGSSHAFFRMSCPGRLVRERTDPIVSPGAVAGHVHTISGGSGFSPSMTFQDARASKCSSCEIREDASNYWTPQLYVNFKNGTFAPVPTIGDPTDTAGGMTVYYLQRRGDNATEKLHAFPEGFRMLAGDTFKRAPSDDSATRGISFACLGAGKPETNRMPNYPCPGGLRAQVFFPACWNGKDLDTPDHKSHMSYPVGREYNTGACPPDFPVHMISLFYEILYDTAPFASEWDGDQHPFVFANGDATGYGYHGDFLNGWDVDALQKAVDTCTDDSGSVAKCAAVTQYPADDCHACRLPSVVGEKTNGARAALPGCNPVTRGPDRASPVSCNDGVTFGTDTSSYVDMTSSKKWSYVGCGTDNIGDRAFRGKSTSSPTMTVQSCIDYCSKAGFSYAGLEYSAECFCANQLDPRYAPRVGFMGACGMQCSGDNSQVCGGWAAMSIYKACGKGPCTNAPLVGSKGSMKPRRRVHARDM